MFPIVSLFLCLSNHRRGAGDIRGLWQRWCSHSPRWPGGGAITERTEPTEEETGPNPPPRNHWGWRGRRRGQGWWNWLHLVALLHYILPSADQETPLTGRRSEAIPLSPPLTLAAVQLMALEPALVIAICHPDLSFKWTSYKLFSFKCSPLS